MIMRCYEKVLSVELRDKFSSVAGPGGFVVIKNVIKTLTVHHVNHDGGGVAGAGGAAVVTGVRVCRLGHDQRTLGALIVKRYK